MENKLPRVLVISSVDPYIGPGIVGLEHYNAIRKGGCQTDFLSLYPVKGHPEFLFVYEKKPHGLIPFVSKIKNYVKDKLNIGPLNHQTPGHHFFYEKETEPQVPVDDVIKKITKRYDVVYIMFWQGMLSFAHIEAIYDKLKCQIQFRCVDYSPMSGGCHFTGDCQRYQIGCGFCPGISSKKENDFTRFNVNYRKKVYDKVRPVVYGNTYMNSFYKKSFLLKNYDRLEIVYPLSDNEAYKPQDYDTLRKKYEISIEKTFIILFGCQNLTDSRKGFSYLLESLHLFYNCLPENERKKVQLVIIGNDVNPIKDKLCFDYKYLGFVPLQDLPGIYSMSSVFLSPSINDAGPTMVNQSMSCGTPVVSFEMGTALDVIKGKGTGYCAKLKDCDDFSKGIYTIFHMSDKDYLDLRLNCRKVALELTSEKAFFQNFIRVYNKYR